MSILCLLGGEEGGRKRERQERERGGERERDREGGREGEREREREDTKGLKRVMSNYNVHVVCLCTFREQMLKCFTHATYPML